MPALRRPLPLILFLVLAAPAAGLAQAPAVAPATTAAPAATTGAAPTSPATSPGATVPQAQAPASPAAPGAPAAGATPADLPHDLSFTNMILNADWVVKSVIALLTLASVLTWTVAVAKTVEFILHGRSTRAGLQTLGASANLDEAARRMAGGACARFVGAARTELETSGAIGAEGIKERTAWKLDRLVAAAGRTMGRGTGLLATVGSVAPFVGLFGTVWGIMNSFIGISKSQTTNLAVVAPGIAEALLATAIGLVAAIPAVVIYNAFARATAGARARLADGVAETMRLLSRDLDRAAAASRPLARLHAAE